MSNLPLALTFIFKPPSLSLSLSLLSFYLPTQASQLGVYRAFVDNYKVAVETAEKCCQANSQFAEISEVSFKGACIILSKQDMISLPLHKFYVFVFLFTFRIWKSRVLKRVKIRMPRTLWKVRAHDSFTDSSTFTLFSLLSILITSLLFSFSALLYKPVDRVTRSTLVLHVSENERAYSQSRVFL